MNSNKTVTANHVKKTYTLTVNALNGSVAKSPNQASYTYGTTVTLTATPNTGYTFTGWSGDLTGTANPATITMNSNKTVTANFIQNTYTLTVGAANGSVVKSPNQVSYTYGTTVTLTATPNAGYTFTGWSGDLTGTANPTTITMNGNKTVTANFSLITTINASVSNASGSPGATSVSVPITLNNIGTREIIGIDIQLTYNSSLITAVEVQKGSLTQNWNLEKNTNTAGEVKIALYSSAKLTSGGEVAKIIFNVKSTAQPGSTSALTLTKFNVNETAVSVLTNGTFTIAAPLGKLDENKLNNLASILSAIQEIFKKIQSYFEILK